MFEKWKCDNWTEDINKAAAQNYSDPIMQNRAEHVRVFMQEVGKYPGWKSDFQQKLGEAKLGGKSNVDKMIWCYDNFAYVTKTPSTPCP